MPAFVQGVDCNCCLPPQLCGLHEGIFRSNKGSAYLCSSLQQSHKPYPLQIKKWVNFYNISPYTLSQLLTLFNWAGFLNLMCFTCLMILCKSLFQVLSFNLSLNFRIHNIFWVHCLLYREPPSSGSFKSVSQEVHLRDVYPCPGWNNECLAIIHLLHMQDFVVLQRGLTM